LGFPLSGAGDVVKFVGVGKVVCALAASGTRQTPMATPVAAVSLREAESLDRVISSLRGESCFASKRRIK